MDFDAEETSNNLNLTIFLYLLSKKNADLKQFMTFCPKFHIPGLVEDIIGLGCKVKSVKDEIPLGIAAGDNAVEVMKKLLEKGADVNQINKVNKNALHFAVENDAYEACVLLLDIGADQDQRDDEGCFPAHYTLDNENERLMKLCIDKGFQPDFCDFTMDVDFVHKIYDKHVRKQYGGRRGMWVYVGDRNSRNDFYF